MNDEKLREQLKEADQLIIAAIDIMTPDQLGQWKGVRAWLESLDLEDFQESSRKK